MVRIKQILLVAGDIILLYGCLGLTLLLRYGKIDQFLVDAHLWPFSTAFVFWLAIFYAASLYDVKSIKRDYFLIETLAVAVLAGLVFSIILFYLIPSFEISPKRNLVIFSLLFFLLSLAWRWFWGRRLTVPQRKILIIGASRGNSELTEFLIRHPQLGYKINFHLKDVGRADEKMIDEIIEQNQINIIIISPQKEKTSRILEIISKKIPLGIEIQDSISAYENLLLKIPLEEMEDLWIATTVSKDRNTYESAKRPLEFLIALVLLAGLFPIIMLVALLIRISSRGPVIYRQVRVGKNDVFFVLYKFRTMVADAEKDGPRWAASKDPRVTAVGKFLRLTHLDELPQLVNIVKGEISFVGPRPERPEFVKELKEKIPHYQLRHVIKPGITGWAQINYRYGASLEDAQEKLRYDLFYIKNRSFVLDFLIILKTIKMFAFRHK